LVERLAAIDNLILAMALETSNTKDINLAMAVYEEKFGA